MFARIVRMNLRPNNRAEFTRTLENDVIPLLQKQKGFRDEVVFIAPDGREAVGISLWDEKEHAETYNRQTYPEVLKALGRVTDETPEVKTYEVTNSTFHQIAARRVAA